MAVGHSGGSFGSQGTPIPASDTRWADIGANLAEGMQSRQDIQEAERLTKEKEEREFEYKKQLQAERGEMEIYSRLIQSGNYELGNAGDEGAIPFQVGDRTLYLVQNTQEGLTSKQRTDITNASEKAAKLAADTAILDGANAKEALAIGEQARADSIYAQTGTADFFGKSEYLSTNNKIEYLTIRNIGNDKTIATTPDGDVRAFTKKELDVEANKTTGKVWTPRAGAPYEKPVSKKVSPATAADAGAGFLKLSEAATLNAIGAIPALGAQAQNFVSGVSKGAVPRVPALSPLEYGKQIVPEAWQDKSTIEALMQGGKGLGTWLTTVPEALQGFQGRDSKINPVIR